MLSAIAALAISIALGTIIYFSVLLWSIRTILLDIKGSVDSAIRLFKENVPVSPISKLTDIDVDLINRMHAEMEAAKYGLDIDVDKDLEYYL